MLWLSLVSEFQALNTVNIQLLKWMDTQTLLISLNILDQFVLKWSLPIASIFQKYMKLIFQFHSGHSQPANAINNQFTDH